MRASWITGFVYFKKDVKSSWFYASLNKVLFGFVVNKFVFVHSVYIKGTRFCMSAVTKYFMSYWAFRHFHILHI